ncbi:MAG: PDZ domain-containing protein [Bdellovibrionales bacterium]|nr:PDZ domain-containing protein [Bdellovibrionales bacterium]
MKNIFKNLFTKRGPDGSRLRQALKPNRVSNAIRKRVPKKINLDSVQEHSLLFRLGLTSLAVLLASAIASRIIGTYFVRPTYTPLPPKKITAPKTKAPTQDFSAIENRNIFNVENKIPEPFDQGLLDCFSQAKPSAQRIKLLGTIVMTDENLSVALLEEEGLPMKVAIKKDDTFSNGRLQALKVDRKKLCFQVRQTQELEFIEIPDDINSLDPFGSGKTTAGITKVSETNYALNQSYLDDQLKDINNVLQTAKAVPYTIDNKMKGFLIQNIEPDSPFASLGLAQGDILMSANDVVFDNLGKGVEAFQILRNAKRINLKVLRAGQEVPLSYEVK